MAALAVPAPNLRGEFSSESPSAMGMCSWRLSNHRNDMESTCAHRQLSTSPIGGRRLLGATEETSTSKAASVPAPDRSPQTSARQLSSETLSPFIAEVTSGHGATSPSAAPGRGRPVVSPSAAWPALGRVLPCGPCPSPPSSLRKSRVDAAQAAAPVSLLGLSCWKSIRLNFNSFSVSVLVPSKGHSHLSINSALCCEIGILRIFLNFLHPLLLLCLRSVFPTRRLPSNTFIKH